MALTWTYSLLTPAATQRQIQALTAQLPTVATTRAGPIGQSSSQQARTTTRAS